MDPLHAHSEYRNTSLSFFFHNILGSHSLLPPPQIQEGDGYNITQSTTMQLRSHSLPAICDLNVPVCFNLKCFKSKWFIFELVSEKKKKTTGFQILNQSICSAFILTSCRYKHPSTKNHKNNSYSCNMIPKLFYYSTEIIKQIGTINTQLLSTKCNFQFTFTFTDYVTL